MSRDQNGAPDGRVNVLRERVLFRPQKQCRGSSPWKAIGRLFFGRYSALAAISAERYDSRKPAPTGHRPSEISVPKMELRTAFVRGSRSPCDWPARPAAMSLSRIAKR